MIKMILSLTMMFLSFIMLYLKHPLSMGLMILLQTFLICLISGMIYNTYWFSYILFLTFLGGLLVLFIYVASIASNELFSISFKLKLFYIISFVFILMLSTLLMNNLNWMNFYNMQEMNNMFNSMLFFNNENCINLTKLYNNQTFFLMMLMIIYLLITLIAVVKITNIFFGPLRSY
uniref:NADH dehydrogenase subunit 6 n=1 Tax=Pseudocoladenia dea TaxID=2866488 RepID=UPI001EDEE11F|nr:NADH dehydrogenase subunit 6 [Pseudocoladenia dea]UJV31565.1 NADH dehydrogenase subunit 6 [Pseudocoladenia dea]WGM81127.1 NADH dehydrogenase subunit 6 [Pseudocoladenia dea]WGM81140.1 NADH dehydrogenase subunit 6 [Pseudocoladenia fabia]WNN66905.1 NADH dehydrogenase subunit 6 [Pseudocoladenia festa]